MGIISVYYGRMCCCLFLFYFFLFCPWESENGEGMGIGLVGCQAQVHHQAVCSRYFIASLFKLFNDYYF